MNRQYIVIRNRSNAPRYTYERGSQHGWLVWEHGRAGKHPICYAETETYAAAIATALNAQRSPVAQSGAVYLINAALN